MRHGVWAGLAVFLLVLLLPLPLPDAAHRTAAVAALMSVWWLTEAVPLAVTSMLPLVLFPALGVLSALATAGPYANRVVFLFLGGFVIGMAMQRWGLHRRMALTIVGRAGARPHTLVLGFMLATAFLSMSISNTATAVMMLPIGLAILRVGEGDEGSAMRNFRKALMLGIAYAASIGGVATLIGTPPNVVMYGVVRDMFETDMSFMSWFVVAFPLAAVVLAFAWFYMTRIGFPLGRDILPGGREAIDRRLTELGGWSRTERIVAVVFGMTAVAWIIRSFVLERLLPGIDDTIIAMAGGIVLFLLPSGHKDGHGILRWEDAVRLPWGIVLLFGGGLALAEAFETTGLAEWIGGRMSTFSAMGTFMMILLILTSVNILTEFTSNVATVTMILPVLAPIAVSAGIHPIALMAGATMVASYGFMMPAGTPPNAIVFGTGYLGIRDMVRTGAVLNIVSVLLITAIVYFVLGPLWGL